MSEIVERFYHIAGIRYRVCCPKSEMYHGDHQLSAFRTDPGSWDQCITFSVADTLPPPEGEAAYKDPARHIYPLGDGFVCYEGGKDPYLRTQWQENQVTAIARRSQIPGRITIKLVLCAMLLPKMLIRHGSFILHASYIRYQDRAILFTAPSGTGKSTQADLWVNLRGAELLNGDRCAVMITPEGIRAAGVPFCGSSGVSKDVTLPLAAIVHLSQAPATTISRLTGLRAFRSVWEGCSIDLWDHNEAAAGTDLVLETVRRVPVFHLACTPDESAVNAVERAILDLR